VYSVRPNHGLPDRPFDTALERSNKSFAKKPITQLEVVPEYHIVVSISGICCLFCLFLGTLCYIFITHACHIYSNVRCTLWVKKWHQTYLRQVYTDFKILSLVHSAVDWKPLKCGSGGWRKWVGRTRRQLRKFCAWSKKTERFLTQYGIESTSGWVVLRQCGILCDVLEGRMLNKSTGGRRRIQLVDDLLETKNYAVLKKAVENRSVWRTIKNTVVNLLSEKITNEWMNEWMLHSAENLQ